MIIPDKIRLFNQNIEIVFDNDYCNGKGVLGEADINHNRIKLCDYFDGHPIPFDRQFHTLCHELIHIMLFMVGQKSIYTDEILTDTLGTALEDLLLNNDFAEQISDGR